MPPLRVRIVITTTFQQIWNAYCTFCHFVNIIIDGREVEEVVQSIAAAPDRPPLDRIGTTQININDRSLDIHSNSIHLWVTRFRCNEEIAGGGERHCFERICQWAAVSVSGHSQSANDRLWFRKAVRCDSDEQKCLCLLGLWEILWRKRKAHTRLHT